MKRTERMFAHYSLMDVLDIQVIGNSICESLGLIEQRREIKNKAEYEYLVNSSQCKFTSHVSGKSFWMQGYPLSITPIRSEENFHLIEFSLENGGFLIQPFALKEGMDTNYRKFLSRIRVTPMGAHVPEQILVEKCGLLVTEHLFGGEISYCLHDVCSKEELVGHKLKSISK